MAIMESHLLNEMNSPTIFALSLFICSVLFLMIKMSSKDSRDKSLPPEAPGSWPLIGHLHLLGGPEPHHKTLSKIAEAHGLVYRIRIGVHQAVVVNNWKIAKECLSTNDKILANRSKGVAVEHLSYNYAMFGFAGYGPHWRQVRRIAVVELLSERRIEMQKHVGRTEVNAGVNLIRKTWMENKDASGKAMIDMKKWFGNVTLNALIRLVAGEALWELSDNDRARCQKAFRDFFELVSLFVPADALPFLRWFDIGGQEKTIKRAAKELDDIVQGWLEKHKMDRASADIPKKQDFMYVMLELFDGCDPSASNYDSDTIIKSTCLAMVLAGSDTTELTLTWALSLLLNHRHVLKQAQDELDAQVGRERQVRESDIKNLVYLQAILKETMRLYPEAPLAVPHEAISDCRVSGFHIPAGTRLFFNLHMIHRDPNVWLNPLEFRPERFLTTHTDVDVRGKNFELIPFGSGRRMCPGVSFALQTMLFTLATLLHNFEFGNQSDESVDMTEGFGLTNLKASPLDVALAPRLADNVYNLTASGLQ